jgi:hypothetical protein
MEKVRLSVQEGWAGPLVSLHRLPSFAAPLGACIHLLFLSSRTAAAVGGKVPGARKERRRPCAPVHARWRAGGKRWRHGEAGAGSRRAELMGIHREGLWSVMAPRSLTAQSPSPPATAASWRVGVCCQKRPTNRPKKTAPSCVISALAFSVLSNGGG